MLDQPICMQSLRGDVLCSACFHPQMQHDASVQVPQMEARQQGRSSVGGQGGQHPAEVSSGRSSCGAWLLLLHLPGSTPHSVKAKKTTVVQRL